MNKKADEDKNIIDLQKKAARNLLLLAY